MTVAEVFLSYHHDDKLLAANVRGQLESLGCVAFLAHEDIEVSAEWRAEILRHLDTCSGLIAIVTDNFSKSPWTNQEVGVVIGKTKPVVSLLFSSSRDLRGF